MGILEPKKGILPKYQLGGELNSAGAGMKKAADIQNITEAEEIKYINQYIEDLKFMENGIKSGYSNGIWTPHKSVEGGSPTIAYGHKLTKGEDYSSGITEEEANKLLKQDLQHHKDRAKNHVDSKYGEGTFDALDPRKKILLTDYEYNVGLRKFPSFLDSLVNNDKDGMLKEYKRYSGAHEMSQRNQWALNIINDL